MILNFKLYWILILIVLSFVLCGCECFLRDINLNPDVTIISKVLHDIADKNLVKVNTVFYVLNFKIQSRFIVDVSIEFSSTVNDKCLKKFLIRTNIYCIDPPFFCESLDDLF